MGMGYFANSTDTIQEETIVKVCKDEFKAFTDSFNGLDFDIEDFAKEYQYGYEIDTDDEEAMKRVSDEYDKLIHTFNERTGLTLDISYHNEDEGSRYDDVNGIYWEVGNIYQLTPEAKAFKEKYGDNTIKSSQFVTFG